VDSLKRTSCYNFRHLALSFLVYRIEAVQDLLDMGRHDNHAHVQTSGAYHYHGVPTELLKELDKGEDNISWLCTGWISNALL